MKNINFFFENKKLLYNIIININYYMINIYICCMSYLFYFTRMLHKVIYMLEVIIKAKAIYLTVMCI